MTFRQLMAWGKRWHYPFLRIGLEADQPTGEVLEHGKMHYRALRQCDTRLGLAIKRAERWNAYVERAEQEKAEREKADNLLAS